MPAFSPLRIMEEAYKRSRHKCLLTGCLNEIVKKLTVAQQIYCSPTEIEMFFPVKQRTKLKINIYLTYPYQQYDVMV